jgi:hypothetical protein
MIPKYLSEELAALLFSYDKAGNGIKNETEEFPEKCGADERCYRVKLDP